MTVGGWFDAEDPVGPLKVFRAIEQNDPETANHLVMGPWSHGAWAWGPGDHLGDVRFNSNTSEYYRDKIEFPFFDYYLNGNGAADLPKAWVFETGTHRWRRFDAWPPKSAEPRRLYLRAGGKLSFHPATHGEAVDEYVSDPNRPVPFIDYISRGMPQPYMVGDQRFATKRTDVLVYATRATRAEDVSIAGPISPDLWVSTSGTDSDFVVKLIDVYPADFPEPGPQPDEGPHGRLPTAHPWRAVPGQVPSQPRDARADGARRADAHRLRDARRGSRLSQGPPHHGADPELLVPAGRSEPAGVRRHPPTPSRRIFRRRRSASAGRRRRARRSPWRSWNRGAAAAERSGGMSIVGEEVEDRHAILNK